MDITSLKQYIVDNDKVELIINDLCCHGFKEYNKEYRCGLPNHRSTSTIAINKETLSVKIFTPDDKTIRGDIVTLVMYIKDAKFIEANKYIHNLMGLEYKFNFKEKGEEKPDPLAVFKKVKRRKYQVNLDDIEIYDEEIIKEYIPLPHILWIREGILPFTCEKFNIGYSADKKRIIIPERYWCGEETDYLGIMGRTTIESYDILDIPKYFPLKSFSKSINLYGLQENYDSIQKAGYCVVAESQKSVLKRHSRKDETVVSIGCHDISDEQVKILIGLNIEIIIAFDKGVTLQHIRYTCEKFYGLKAVSYIWDKYDVIENKQAPMDLPDKTYKYMLKYKVKYDEKEHKEYLKEREKNEKRL
jgi:DNA primase